jgi:hypothetical protein
VATARIGHRVDEASPLHGGEEGDARRLHAVVHGGNGRCGWGEVARSGRRDGLERDVLANVAAARGAWKLRANARLFDPAPRSITVASADRIRSHRYVILSYVVILTNILSYDYIISQVFCSCLLLSEKHSAQIKNETIAL